MRKLYDDTKSYLLYFFMYCPLGFVCPLIGQYCSSIGFSGTEVGIVTSCGTLGAVVGGIVWGKAFANANRKRYVVILIFLMAGLMAIVSTYIKVFLGFALMYGLIYFFQGPSHGLCDHMMVSGDRDFPRIRAMGAIGYAVASFVAGMLSEKYGLQIIFFMHAAGYVIASVVMKTEEEPPHYSDHENKASIRELFKNKKFIKLMICSFMILGPLMANNTYFSYLYIDAGGELSGVGFAFLLMAGSEALFMFLVPLAEKKLPTERLITIGAAVCVLRFGFYALGPSTGALLATFFLQGIMNGIILVEMVKYFGKIVEPRLSSVSVSTYYALGNNFSAIVANLIGGIVMDGWGIKGTFLVFAVWNAVGLFLYLIMGLNRTEKYTKNL